MKTAAEYTRDWRARNPDRVRQQQRAHRERHKAVLAEKNKAWRASNPEAVAIYAERDKAKRASPGVKAARRQYIQEYYATPAGRAAQMMCGARHRARLKGVECSITREWIEERVVAGVCEVTGLPFNLSGQGASSRDPWAPSLDRTDSSLGYTKENTKVVVCIYNYAKSDFTPDDVMRMAIALKADKA